MRTSYLLLCCSQMILLCTTLNTTNQMKIECEVEMQWHSSIIVQLIQKFHWNKLALVTYDNQKCSQEFIFVVKLFSQHWISAAVSSIGNSIDLNNSNTVIILIRKTADLNPVLGIVKTKLAYRNCPKNWVLIHKNEEAVDLLSFFIPIDINIFLIETHPIKKIWHVYRFYSITGTEITKKRVGIGHENRNELKIEIPNVSSPNLMGEKIRFVTITFEPYFTYDKFNPKDGGKPTGLYGEIVATLQPFINFSMTISASEDNQFGKIVDDQNVTGILGKLHRNESDIGVGLALSKDRVSLIDYSPSVHSMQIKILFHQIYGAKQRFFFYLEPFSSVAWTCISFLTILAAFLLSMTYNCTQRTIRVASVINRKWKKIKINNIYKKWFFDFLHYVEYMAYTFLRTGVAVRVYGLSGHMIIQIFHLFSLMMFIHYSSTLTSILTVSRLHVPFESLDDLVYRTSYTLSTMKGTFIEASFKNTPTGALSVGWKKMKSNLMKYVVESNVKGLDLVYKEQNAYVMESASLTVLLNGNCSFAFVKNTVQQSDLCIGYRRGFVYKNLFNTYVQALKENGILKKIDKDNLPLDHNEVCKDKNLFAALKLPKVVGLFFTLSAGIVFSLLLLTVEICFFKYPPHSLNKCFQFRSKIW